MSQSGMSSEDSDELPDLPSELSRGSSVSTDLQEEYEDLIKYAVVTPKWEPSVVKQHGNASIPQLRLTDPDARPLTTVDQYQADTESNNEVGDSAMGSDVPETNRTEQSSIAPKPIPSPGRTPFRVPNLSPSESSERVPTPPISLAQYLRSSHKIQNETPVTIDPDMYSMANSLDQWSVDLKTMVLGELSKMKACMIDRDRAEKEETKEIHQKEINTLKDEISHLKMLLNTYEESVERKDQVISNLTRGVQNGRDRIAMAKAFMHWKVRLMDEKRQIFTSHLARKHRQRVVAMRAWQGWRATVEAKWKDRVEKACQNKAQEVCEKLAEDYEKKILSIKEELNKARAEVDNLQSERETYEEAMKKAFMRGVCALNIEAMSVFQNQDGKQIEEVQTIAAAVNKLSCATEPTQRDAKPTRDIEVSTQSQIVRHDATDQAVTITKEQLDRIHPVQTSTVRNSKKQNPRQKLSTRKVRTKNPMEQYPTVPTGVLVERHMPNLQNLNIGTTLNHAAKYPHAPTQVIAGQNQTIKHVQ